MPENSKAGTVAYQCECGKKWAFSKAEINKAGSQQCACGRTIVVYKGGTYSTRKK